MICNAHLSYSIIEHNGKLQHKQYSLGGACQAHGRLQLAFMGLVVSCAVVLL